MGPSSKLVVSKVTGQEWAARDCDATPDNDSSGPWYGAVCTGCVMCQENPCDYKDSRRGVGLRSRDKTPSQGLGHIAREELGRLSDILS